MLNVDKKHRSISREGMTMSAKSIGPRRATLAGEVRAEIERMIVEGDLAGGQKLNEVQLSNAMGVSRGTVREAIRSLADSGLIELIANRGAFVHEMTLADVRNLYDLRGAVFAMACAASARRVRDGLEPAFPAKLERNLTQMRQATDKADTAKYYKLNIEFHDMLLEAAANAKAKTVYDNLVKEMHLFRRRGLSVPTNMARSLAEHEEIAKAVLAGQPEPARLAAHDHITAGFARYIKTHDQDTEASGPV
jgi:DNA-binding GntR family transcriptional regulator